MATNGLVGFAGAMQGSVNAAHEIQPRLTSFGHTSIILPAIPQPARTPWSSEVMETLRGCSLVVLGAASFPEERVAEENLAQLLLEWKIPFLVLADTPESVNRYECNGVIKDNAIAIILATDDLEGARKHKWSNPFYFGLPPHLEKSYSAMREKTNSQFSAVKDGTRSEVGIRPVVLYPGTKDFAQDERMLRVVIDASTVIIGSDVVVGYRPHPTLKNDPACARIDALFGGVARLDYGNATLPQTIGQSTITFFAGLSSELLSAAHAGVGGVYVSDEVSRKRNLDQGAVDGIPEVVRRGAFPHATSLDGIYGALAEAYEDWEGFAEKRARMFPEPELGSARSIANYIDVLLTIP